MSKGGSTPSGDTTVTTKSDPWSGQQPFLQQGFQQAQNLFNQGGAQFYPGQSYAGPTDLQQTGIENEANIGLNGTQAQASANGSLSNILNSNWLNANPSNGVYNSAANGGLNVNTGGYFQPLASGQQTNTMGVPTLQDVSNGAGSDPLSGPAANTLGTAASGGLTNNYGLAPISAIAGGSNQNTGGQGTLGAAANGQLANTQGQNVLGSIASGVNNVQPGMQTLANIASGSNLSAQNPYFQQMADTIRANVLPGIEGQFNAGNRLDSGLASRAVGQGLGDSIGSLAYNNYQQGLQQQQSAASNLASLGQNATAQQASAAGNLGQLGQSNLSQQLGAANSLGNFGAGNLSAQLQAGGLLSGIGAQNISNQLGAANSLGSFGQQGIQNRLGAAGQLAGIGQNNISNQLSAGNALSNIGFGNAGQQLTGAQGLSQNFQNAGQQQLGALGLAPSIGNLDYQQAAALQDAGTTTQGLNQAAINDAMARYNFGQQQPYANLQNYMQNIQGNYGGTQTQTTPYYQNGTANALSTGLGAFTLGNAATGGQLSSGLSNLFGNLFGSSQVPSQVTNFLNQGIF